MTQQKHFYFLDWLRGFAAWLVVYDHLIAIYTRDRALDFTPVNYITEYITQPLGIIQDFGWLGVSLFFLISGFVITHVSQRENLLEFVVKRFFRIFPLLAVAICISIMVSPQLIEQATLGTLISNVFLVNYWNHPQIVLLGVAWTLAIEITFYLLVIAFYYWRASPFKLIFAQLSLIGIGIFFARSMGDSYFLFSATVAYIPYLIFGSIFYHVFYSQKLGNLECLILVVLCYAATLTGIKSIHTSFLPITNSYIGNFVLSLLIFSMAHGINERLAPNRVAKFFADTSYVVYLIHGTLGIFILNILTPKFGFNVALLVTLPTLGLISWGMHKYLEVPILKFSRTILKKLNSNNFTVQKSNSRSM
jgi:exopolysaccharide production protein ExoZ